MKAYILIQADEGSTALIYYRRGTLDDLQNTIRDHCMEEQKTARPDFNDAEYEAERANALIQMLDNRSYDGSYYNIETHQRIEKISTFDEDQNGRYDLINIEPHWQEWTLIIADDWYHDEVK